MIVIKLGGSLMQDAPALKQCLNTIERDYQGRVIIVPGGGVFADQVRNLQQQWAFNDVCAHQMALLAMQQTALLFNSIRPSFTIIPQVSTLMMSASCPAVAIWSPDINELNVAGIQPSWDITSDSLAAWLAQQLAAEQLILVKSAETPLHFDCHQAVEQGLVDQAFNQFTEQASYKITLINKNRFNGNIRT